MNPVDKYLKYLSSVRRYSPRTVQIYSDILKRYLVHCGVAPEDVLKVLSIGDIRDYQVYLTHDSSLGARTASQHLSVLSGFCSFLVKDGLLESNPARLVKRPKVEKRLPVFYREKSIQEYFDKTNWKTEDINIKYKERLSRMVVSLLFATGMRRSELISLRIGSVDFARNVIHVRGKGNKMREIPMISSLSEELLLYLQSTETLLGRSRTAAEPLLVSEKGKELYPMAVERIVKAELGEIDSIAGRKSPHLLRHTLATELLEKGSDLNAIKELLGHSSLAATQVYTHNSIGKLKTVYNNAHPRAKKGGNNGD